MSQQGERSDQPGTPGLESGLEALRQSPFAFFCVAREFDSPDLANR